MTGHSSQVKLRNGLDLGGSKIEGILLSPEARELARHRIATPRDNYQATIEAIVDLTARFMQGVTTEATIGIAVPGSISPPTGLMQNANSTWLNGRPFDRDLEAALAIRCDLPMTPTASPCPKPEMGQQRTPTPRLGLF